MSLLRHIDREDAKRRATSSKSCIPALALIFTAFVAADQIKNVGNRALSMATGDPINATRMTTQAATYLVEQTHKGIAAAVQTFE